MKAYKRRCGSLKLLMWQKMLVFSSCPEHLLMTFLHLKAILANAEKPKLTEKPHPTHKPTARSDRSRKKKKTQCAANNTLPLNWKKRTIKHFIERGIFFSRASNHESACLPQSCCTVEMGIIPRLPDYFRDRDETTLGSLKKCWKCTTIKWFELPPCITGSS